jgi:hypothetical protein
MISMTAVNACVAQGARQSRQVQGCDRALVTIATRGCLQERQQQLGALEKRTPT